MWMRGGPVDNEGMAVWTTGYPHFRGLYAEPLRRLEFESFCFVAGTYDIGGLIHGPTTTTT